MSGLEVIAIGARTPLGFLAETSAAAARAGLSRVREFPFVTPKGQPMMIAADEQLSPRVEGIARLMPMANAALWQIAHKLAAAARPYEGEIDLWLALPEPRPGLGEAEIMQFVDTLITTLHGNGTRLRYEVAGRGHAGVAEALTRAAQVIAHHDERLSLVLGVDTYLDPRTLLWLEHNRCLGPSARSGFPPGEAAGCLMVASARQRKQLGLPCLAQITGLGLAHEPRPLGDECGSLGEGMTAALRAATSQLRLPSEAVDAVFSDINGERHRSEEWGFVALRMPELFRTLDYEAPADAWGDLGAASGALLGVLAIQSWARRYARGPRALVLTGSTSGQRGVILLEQPPP
jgi:3-oxoacyl-[acyl-carrier-protein] synthase-1